MATVTIDRFALEKAKAVAGESTSFPSTLYLAVFSTAPGSDGSGGVELTGTAGTLRQAVSWNAASGTSVSSSDSIEFTLSGGSWLGPVAEGLYDSATGGNLWHLETFTQKNAVADGESYRNNSITYQGS